MQCGSCGSENLKNATYCSNCGAKMNYMKGSDSDTKEAGVTPQQNNKPTKLYRSRGDRVIAGVCGGLGKYFGIDSNIVRILFVLFVTAGGSGLFLYIILLAIIPESPTDPWKEQ